MNKCIYQFKIISSHNQAIENKAIQLFVRLIQTNADLSIVFADCDDSFDEFYLFWNMQNCEQLLNEFRSIGAEVSASDLTNSVISGTIDEQFKIIFQKESYNEILMDFLSTYYSIDDLLDKINSTGSYNQLSDYEKLTLNHLTKTLY
jgi:hypothetical protein